MTSNRSCVPLPRPIGILCASEALTTAIVGQRHVVGGDDGGAKTAAKQDVGRALGRPVGVGIEGVGGARRKGPALRVVEDDVVAGDVGELGCGETELGGID